MHTHTSISGVLVASFVSAAGGPLTLRTANKSRFREKDRHTPAPRCGNEPLTCVPFPPSFPVLVGLVISHR